jgi:hypothetical protein
MVSRCISIRTLNRDKVKKYYDYFFIFVSFISVLTEIKEPI